MHNRKAMRLKEYDYSQNGMYFITICTKHMEKLFGNIINGKMILNEYGKIAEKNWNAIKDHFDYTNIQESVIMPDHIHAIIEIMNIDSVGNRHACSLQNRQYQKLPVIIGSYKSSVTRDINKKFDTYFQWQKSYYDHIIRNEIELTNIRKYIINNPIQSNIKP